MYDNSSGTGWSSRHPFHMARFARVVIPGFADHITQRGNLRQDVFFSDADRRMYLTILRNHVRRHGVRILVPHYQPCAHRPRARRLARHGRSAGPITSTPGGCTSASGASATCGRTDSTPVPWRDVTSGKRSLHGTESRARQNGANSRRVAMVEREGAPRRWSIETWRVALRTPAEAGFAARLREATQTGRPCGEDGFAEMLEREVGGHSGRRSAGPKPKNDTDPRQMSSGVRSPAARHADSAHLRPLPTVTLPLRCSRYWSEALPI